MIIRWPTFWLALVLLAPPPLLSSELRRVVTSVRRNAALSVPSLLRPWQNWVDFVRASLGTWFLTKFAILPDPSKEVGPKALLLQFALLGTALLLQTTRVDLKAPRSEQKLQLMAPIFYLCGMTLLLSGLSGAFAVFVGWVFAIASKNPSYQLPAMAVGLIAGGFVFGLGLAVMLNIGLVVLPYFEAFVLRKRLVFMGLATPLRSPALKGT
jgi:hypothetical protein